MEPKTKQILIIGGSVAVVGTVIYLITRKKDVPERPPFTPKTSPTITNPNQNFPPQNQQQGAGSVVVSEDTVNWYPSWLPPFTISF